MMLLGLLFSILAGVAQATTYTTNGAAGSSGTWNNASAYVGNSGTPGTNDHVSITNGFQLHAPENFGVLSGSITMIGGTNALRTKLIFDHNSTIQISSTMACTGSSGNCEIDMSSGSVLSMGTFTFVFNANGTSNNIFYFLGAASSHVTVISSGGFFVQGGQGGFDQLEATMTYTDFNGLGTAATPGFGFGYCAAGHNFIISSSTWINSGYLQLPQTGTSPCLQRYIEYSDFRTGLGANSIRWRGSNTNNPTTRNDFVGNTVSTGAATAVQVLDVEGTSVTFRENIFVNQTFQHVGSFGLDAIISSNVWITTVTANATTQIANLAGFSSLQANMMLSESDNPHYVQGFGTRTISGNFVETKTSGTITDDGDFALITNSANAVDSTTIVGNIFLGKRNSTVILSMQGSSTLTEYGRVEHNTVFFDSGTSVTKDCTRVGETYTGKSNMWQSIQSNLCVANSSSSTNAWIVRDQNAGSADQKVSTANYNGYWNIPGARYGVTRTVGSYGVNDVRADPVFIDTRCDALNWDSSLGGAGTTSSLANNLLNKNGYGGTHNAAYNLTAFMTYIRTCFTPQNQAYKGTAHDGGDIGAVSVAPNRIFFKMVGP